MTGSSRWAMRALPASTMAVALLIAGCSSAPVDENPAAATAAQLDGLPVTFTGSSIATTGVTAFTATPTGLAVASASGDGATLTFVDPDGSTAWSAPLSAPASAVYGTREDDADWVTARVGPDLLLFNAASTGTQVSPHRIVPVGDASISATSTRLMTDAPAIVNSGAGDLTRISLGAGESAVAATSDGVLVTAEGGLRGLLSERGGWSAAEHAPGASKGSSPTYVTQNHGIVVVRWGDTIGALRLHDGEMLGAIEAPEGELPAVVIADDGSAVAVGSRLLDIATRSATAAPAGFTPSAAFEGVVYGTARDEAPTAIDALTGAPLGAGDAERLPTAFTGWRDGLLLTDSGEKGASKLSIAPLRPLDTPR